MNREFVPYEIAVELKGLRFDEPCFAWFGPTGKFNDWDTTDTIAPLYQQAFRFFREKYALHASIHADLSWNISGGVWDLDGYADSRYDWDSEPFKTFEEAELDCLSNLVKIVKANEP
jgi:hypothetical protein